MTEAVRVLLADDEELVRSGFRMLLEAEPDIEVVGAAADGAEAVELGTMLRPDLVLMDIRMPRLDGLAATEMLAGPGVADPLRVLVLTTFELDEYVYGALRAGASGFLFKDTSSEELVRAVHTVAAGDALLAPAVTRKLIDEFASAARPGAIPPGLATLTSREHDVFVLIARGYSNTEIAAELLLGETTVKTHVGRVLAKLRLRDRVHAVVLAYEHGVVRPGRQG